MFSFSNSLLDLNSIGIAHYIGQRKGQKSSGERLVITEMSRTGGTPLAQAMAVIEELDGQGGKHQRERDHAVCRKQTLRETEFVT